MSEYTVCVFIPIILEKGNYIYKYIKTKYFLDFLKQIIINYYEWVCVVY